MSTHAPASGGSGGYGFRRANIGAALGFLVVFSAVMTAGLVAGIGTGSSFGLALWIGFWGGGGFGFMLGGSVQPRSRGD